jgi:hypothetical protein
MISVFLSRKQNYSKIKVYCKQNRHFYRDFFEGFQIFLTSSLYSLDPSQWSLMSLITGNKVKKTHKPRYCEKEKDKANLFIDSLPYLKKKQKDHKELRFRS